ncbi:MAG: hypothetical protein ACRDD7_12635 [Peptostreptococcaceae bacterium]
MNRSQILAIGCGGCGNNQLDKLLNLDKRYSGIFFNTNYREMCELETFDELRRSFYIPNADGTGKNRKVAEGYIKTEAPKFAEMIGKFTNQPAVLLKSSANGGTGSTAVSLLPKLMKQIKVMKNITVMSTFPSINESDIDFENAIEFWNELMNNYNRGLITNLMFIDNNKGSESEVNDKATKVYNSMFEIVGGKIDSSDLSRAITSKGYSTTLILDDTSGDTKNAIDKAISNSVFFIPEGNDDGTFDCNVMLATVNTTHYDVDVIKTKFPAYEFCKVKEVTEGDTIITLGGCNIPKEPIQLIQEALRELQNRKRKRQVNDDLIVEVKPIKNKNDLANTNIVGVPSNSFTSKDLNDLFDDDSFWD